MILDIQNVGKIEIKNIVFNYNGTIAKDVKLAIKSKKK